MARLLEVTLELSNASPRVWRRVRLRSDLSLADLHRVIQAVMHWDDVHLHVFDIDGREYGPPPDEEEISLTWAGDDAAITLAKALALGRGRFEYTYDFRAERRVEIIALDQAIAGPSRMLCVDGAGGGFNPTEINTRLAREFQAHGAGEAGTPEERLLSDLTLLLLFLTSHEEGRGTLVANKTLRLDTLDALADAGLVITNKHRKGVQLTSRGVEQAETLLQRVTSLLQSSSPQ